MRSLLLLHLGLMAATAVNGVVVQQPLAGVVTNQPIHTTEGWSYEDCGS